MPRPLSRLGATMPKRNRPTLVRWIDACDAAPEWTPADQVAKSGAVNCESVGFLVDQDDDRLVLVTSLSDDGDAASGIVIPTGCVLEVTYLDAI